MFKKKIGANKIKTGRTWGKDVAIACVAKKDDLKARGYSWLPDCPYRDQYDNEKHGVWTVLVDETETEREQQWLTDSVFEFGSSF